MGPKAVAGYSGTPLPKKLGIRQNSRVVLVNSREPFERKLEPLPAGPEIIEDAGKAGVALLFVKSEAELIRGFRALAGCFPQ